MSQPVAAEIRPISIRKKIGLSSVSAARGVNYISRFLYNALYQHTDITHRKWFLHKMLLWILHGLCFLCWISAAACNSRFFPRPFIRVQFIFSACHSSYWYMLRGRSVAGNLITSSSTCQFQPSLCRPTLLFIMSPLQLAISPQNKQRSPDCCHWLQTYGFWITNSNMHI